MERDNSSISSFSKNLRSTIIRYSGLKHRRQLRRQLLIAKLYSLEEDLKLTDESITLMQLQQLNDKDKLFRCCNQLQTLRANQIEQQRQIQLVEEEIKKLRTLPAAIEREISYFLEQLDQLQQQQPPSPPPPPPPYPQQE